MRSIVCLLILIASIPAFAQDEVVLTKGFTPLHNVFQSDSLILIQNTIFHLNESYPLPAGIDPKIKYFADQVRLNPLHHDVKRSSKRSAMLPVVESGFSGANNEGTPNDNNMAVNNDSFVVSVLNTFIRVYNTNGVFKKNWSLEFFPKDPNAVKPGNGVSTLDRSYDPKILFDPQSNRFILVYLEGSESSDTRIIVAFSKTSNPLNGWNVYQLNGNPFGGKFWTDYPMIAINGEDLFITVNILKDNTDWRDGFTQSVIWQIPKSRGYNADTLMHNLWSNIKHNGKAIWNICPVQDAFQPGKEGLYFLSVEPGDALNDTVYLHSINYNFSNGNPQYSYKVLQSNKSYGLPPFAKQKTAGYRLQTNDARVLGAFYINNKIQFVQTSINPGNGRSSVYHGIIQFPDNPVPEVKANIISYDSLDISYPTIVCAGNTDFGRQSLITFSHSSETVFPGTSIVYFDNNGEYSDLVMVKKGEGIINSFIPDTAERWGDYTSIQRRYNNLNEFWLAGSYGKNTNAVGTWIGKIKVNDPSVSTNQMNNIPEPNAYPNPVADMFSIPFELMMNGRVRIEIRDMQGKIVESFSSELTSGKQLAVINTSRYTSGMYQYVILTESNEVKSGIFCKI